MLKPIIGGVVGVLIAFPPVIAQAQTQPLNPQVLSQATTGATGTISPLEMQQFVQALKQLKKIEMETQEKMVAALKQERLSPERFQEIGQQRNNPDPTTAGISPKDLEHFDKALAKIQTIKQEAAPKETRAISMQGLTTERFNQIGEMINSSPTLQQQLKNSI
jgi:hypothetical protein